MNNLMGNNEKQIPFVWWVVALFVMLLILKSYWVFHSTGPGIFGDEFLYMNNARNIFNMLPYASGPYPPLYSLFLSPAFLSQEHWYEWMIFINIILSSSIIFPVYLISKKLLPKQAVFVPVIIAALLPFHFIYPSLLMSENLSISLFLFAFYFAVVQTNRNWYSAAMLGAFLALSYLTKYLFLPAVIFLIVVWSLIPLFQKNYKGKSLREKLHLSHVAALAAGFLTLCAPWLLYAHYSGIPIRKAMGLFWVDSYSTRIKKSTFVLSEARTDIPNFDSLVLWITAYWSYLILVLAPFLFILCLYLVTRAYKYGEHQFREKFYFFTVIMLTIGYLLLATQHSWGAAYNYPTPQYLSGRYLMHLTPLYAVAAVIGLYKLVYHAQYIKHVVIIAVSLFSMLLIYAAQKILYAQAIWNLPAWFADLVFNSPDSFVYKHYFMLWGVLTITVLTGGCLILCKKYQGFISRHIVSIIMGFLIFSQCVIFYGATNRAMKQDFLPLHSRILAPILKNDFNNGIETVAFRIDIPHLIPEIFLNSLQFWGLPKSRIAACTTNVCLEIKPSDNVKKYLLTGTHYDLPRAFTYSADNKHYYLYAVTDGKINAKAPVIDDFGPKSSKAGVGFNIQPSGRSALWLRTKYATSSTVVIFNNIELETIYGDSNSLAALVPDYLFEKSGKYFVYLSDKERGGESNRMVFTVQ